MMWKKLGIVAIVAAGLSAMSVACAADDECVGGKVCSCANCNKACESEGNKSCQFTCTGGNCSFTCKGGGCQIDARNADSVTVDCPGGGCQITSTNTKSSTVACSGNGCNHTCSGAQSCKTSQCTGGCTLECGGAATCDQSCSETSGCTGGTSSLPGTGSSGGAGLPDAGFDPTGSSGGDFGGEQP